jgi:hypothetical protein
MRRPLLRDLTEFLFQFGQVGFNAEAQACRNVA